MILETEFSIDQKVYILNPDNLYDPILKGEIVSITIDKAGPVEYTIEITGYGLLPYEKRTGQIFKTFQEAKEALIEQISELEESKYA